MEKTVTLCDCGCGTELPDAPRIALQVAVTDFVDGADDPEQHADAVQAYATRASSWLTFVDATHAANYATAVAKGKAELELH